MSFAFPLALFGLLAVPALVAIYWLRNRSRRRVVSSLMLWMDQRQLKEGGLLIHRLQTPLLFFLELLSILLIVLAAAGPMVRAGDSASPLVIVLDDSFSMLAGEDDSARNQAAKAVRQQVLNAGAATVRIVLAGETPQLLGETNNQQPPEALLEQWRCFSSGANLEEAVTFAFSIGGERSRTLVVTDHQPPAETNTENLQWLAFGRRRPNLAFVNATRTARDGRDRCMLEIANLSDNPARADLVLEGENASGSKSFRELQRSQIDVASNATHRVTLTLVPGAGAIRARIDADALSIDDEVILLPSRERPVRVQISIMNDVLRELVESAIRASAIAEIVPSDPELLLTDEADRAATPRSWVVRISNDQDAESYLGPFVVDRSHPLTEGLALDGVIWGAGKSAVSGGSAVIMAGNIPLASIIGEVDGSREIRLSFRPDLSTLQRTTAWPVLLWNLLSWRVSELPGVSQSNIRLGSDIKVTLPPGVTSIEVIEPAGTSRQIAVPERTLSFKPASPGTYELTAESGLYSFAANPLNREESNLSASASGSWGSLDGVEGSERGLRSVAWVFLLLLMAALSLHLFLLSRGALSKKA